MERRAVKRSIIINAHAAEVWKAIVDPEIIRKFLFGTHIKTDWKVGSTITYWGTYKGKDYEDKGIITKVEKEKRFEHTHWSNLSGTEDIPENYFEVIYELDEKENHTVLVITQVGLMSEDSYKQSAENWEGVLQRIKELVEKEVVANQVVS